MMQKRELVLFLALAAVAAGIWYFQLNPRGPALSAADGEIVPGDKLGVDNPQLHWWKIAAARKTTYDFSRRNIFSAAAESPVRNPAGKKGSPLRLPRKPSPSCLRPRRFASSLLCPSSSSATPPPLPAAHSAPSSPTASRSTWLAKGNSCWEDFASCKLKKPASSMKK